MGEKNVLPEMGLAVLQIALSVGYLEEFGEVFVSVFPMDRSVLPMNRGQDRLCKGALKDG